MNSTDPVCKHRSHRAYADQLEAFYLHAHMAQQDLLKALDEARHIAGGMRLQTGDVLNHTAVLDARDRLNHAESEYNLALEKVSFHQRNGKCALVAALEAAGVDA